MNSNEPKDGTERRERAVAEGTELRERAVAYARKVGEALGLKEAPVSPDAPPAYPAPPVPAPPFPRRVLKETLPSTPRAIARQVAESLPPLEPSAPDVEPAPTPIPATAPAAAASPPPGPATER